MSTILLKYQTVSWFLIAWFYSQCLHLCSFTCDSYHKMICSVTQRQQPCSNFFATLSTFQPTCWYHTSDRCNLLFRCHLCPVWTDKPLYLPAVSVALQANEVISFPTVMRRWRIRSWCLLFCLVLPLFPPLLSSVRIAHNKKHMQWIVQLKKTSLFKLLWQSYYYTTNSLIITVREMLMTVQSKPFNPPFKNVKCSFVSASIQVLILKIKCY